MSDKYCVNCKWSYRRNNSYMCKRPSGEISLVTGHQEPREILCNIERTESVTSCGPTGRFFQPATKEMLYGLGIAVSIIAIVGAAAARWLGFL